MTGLLWADLFSWGGYGGGGGGVATIPYDYGTTVCYQDDGVYVQGNRVGSAAEYAQGASDLAAAGNAAKPADDDQWRSLGVFAMGRAEESDPSNFLSLAVDKAGLLGFFDYIALLGNTISGTHGGAPIGTKGAFSLDGTAGPFAPGATTFYAAGNTLGVTTYRGGYSTAMDTVLYPAASDQALMGRNASYATPNAVITAIVTADWNWTASVTIQKVA